LLYWMAYHA